MQLKLSLWYIHWLPRVYSAQSCRTRQNKSFFLSQTYLAKCCLVLKICVTPWYHITHLTLCVSSLFNTHAQQAQQCNLEDWTGQWLLYSTSSGVTHFSKTNGLPRSWQGQWKLLASSIKFHTRTSQKCLWVIWLSQRLEGKKLSKTVMLYIRPTVLWHTSIWKTKPQCCMIQNYEANINSMKEVKVHGWFCKQILGIWHNAADGTAEMDMGRGWRRGKDNTRFDVMYQCKTRLLLKNNPGKYHLSARHYLGKCNLFLTVCLRGEYMSVQLLLFYTNNWKS